MSRWAQGMFFTNSFRKAAPVIELAYPFLKEFVKDIPWAHLDIAGTAFNEGEARGEVPKFATGFGVRLLMDYLSD